jgi:nucleoside-diphosphate-sugar epimerase
MKQALVIGNGQIGSEIAAQLTAAGIAVRIATRSGARAQQPVTAGAPPLVSAATPAAEPAPEHVKTDATTPTHVRADATDPAQLAEAADGVDVIFACAHAPYDSRKWEQILPRMDQAVLDTAAELNVPVVFPESVYAFAGLDRPITEDSPFAPVDAKGRIRQRLLESRTAHPATSASVIAGDLLGRTAEPKSSVVRMCITEPISHGRRALLPARADVAHGITVIADLADAMIRAAELLADSPTGTHRLLIAPASNPTLAEIAEFTHAELGSRAKKPLALPHWVIGVIGLLDRSMFEVGQLGPIWYEPCIVEPGILAGSVPTTDWREGVRQML